MGHKVIIVGAGPAGSAAAITLLRRGVEVVVFEPALAPDNKLAETLYPDAEVLLRALGSVQIRKRPASVHYVGRDAETELMVSFNSRIGIVDRNELDLELRRIALELGSQWVSKRVDKITASANEVVLEAGGEHHVGAYLVDASGKNPITVAALHSEPAVPLDNRFNAFSHFVCSSRFCIDTGTIVALQDGFAYILPIRADRICIGIASYTAFDEIDCEGAYTRQLNSSVFLADLIRQARRVLPVIRAKNLQTFNSPIVNERVVRAGDALGFRDPFLWDGLSFALETGRAAGESCATAIATGRSDHTTFSEFASKLEASIRQRVNAQHDKLVAQFNPAMMVDPHVSPIMLGCLFAMTGDTKRGGLPGLRDRLNAQRVLQ